MNHAGLSKVIALLSVVTIVVAIVAFFGGVYLSNSGPRISSMQTTTIPSIVAVTKTVTQIAGQTQASSPLATSIQPSAQLPEKIVLGAAIALSGPQSRYGKTGFWGIMAATKWVNEVYGGVHLYGRAIPIEVKYYDDESKRENTIAYTERLITVDKVNFLLSTHSSPLVFAQAPVAEKYKMLLVNWGGASDAIHSQGYKYVVQVLTPASQYQWTALEALKSANPNAKISILYKDDEFNRACGGGVSSKAKELGFSIVYEKMYPADANDLSPYITDLARSGSDALFVCSHDPDGQLLTKQLIDLNVNFKLISITLAPCGYGYYDTFKTLAEGILCPSQWEPAVKFTPDLAKSMGIEWFGPTTDDFLSLLDKVKKEDPRVAGAVGDLKPDYGTGMGAAAILSLVKAIEIAQSLDPTAVREAFNKVYIMTFYGLLKIDPATGRQIAHQMVLTQWQGSRQVVVWPSGVAQAKLYYPIPTWDEKRAGKVASY